MSEPSSGNRRLAAVMCLDMAGYSALMSRSESLALSCIKSLEEILYSEISLAGGRLVKLIGDGSLAEFSTAVAAVSCSRNILKRIASLNTSRPQPERFEVRIGLHLGEVVDREGDIFGDAVNIAARVQPLADPGGIAMTGVVYTQVKNQTSLDGLLLPAQKLKNIPEKVSIYLIPPQGTSLLLWRLKRREFSAAWGGVMVFFAILATGFGSIWLYYRTNPNSLGEPQQFRPATFKAELTRPQSGQDEKAPQISVEGHQPPQKPLKPQEPQRESPSPMPRPPQESVPKPAFDQTSPVRSAMPNDEIASVTVVESQGTNQDNPAFLEVQVEGIINVGGEIGVALFNKKMGYPIYIEHSYEGEWVPLQVKQAVVNVTFDSLPAGEYAVSVLHDENGNKKLERSTLGFPTEGVGFSNDQKVTLRAPKFQESKFGLSSGENKKITIQMDYRHRR